jgi:hypothetical protein
VSDQVSHPYRTTGKITVVYILTFSHSKDALQSCSNQDRWIFCRCLQFSEQAANISLNSLNRLAFATKACKFP